MAAFAAGDCVGPKMRSTVNRAGKQSLEVRAAPSRSVSFSRTTPPPSKERCLARGGGLEEEEDEEEEEEDDDDDDDESEEEEEEDTSATSSPPSPSPPSSPSSPPDDDEPTPNPHSSSRTPSSSDVFPAKKSVLICTRKRTSFPLMPLAWLHHRMSSPPLTGRPTL